MQKLLTPDGAEFLVLGNLLVRGIYAYKNYVNTPDFDVVAFNPDNNKKIARIEVKSRQYKDAKMYQLRSFKSDFVVFVQLNKYTRTKKKKRLCTTQMHCLLNASIKMLHVMIIESFRDQIP